MHGDCAVNIEFVFGLQEFLEYFFIISWKLLQSGNFLVLVHFWSILRENLKKERRKKITKSFKILFQSLLISPICKTISKTRTNQKKTFLKLKLEEDYCDYGNALKIWELRTLDNRRKKLMLSFAQTSLADDMLTNLFQRNKKKTPQNEEKKQRKFFMPILIVLKSPQFRQCSKYWTQLKSHKH